MRRVRWLPQRTSPRVADRSRAHFGLKHAMRERARGSYVSLSSNGHRKRTTGAQCREDKEPKRIRLLLKGLLHN